MSARATFWAWEQDINHSPTFLVLLCLADGAGDEDSCFPSIPTIARRTKHCESTVKNSLAKLEALGFITRFQRKRQNGSDTSCLIRLNVGQVTMQVKSYGPRDAIECDGGWRGHVVAQGGACGAPQGGHVVAPPNLLSRNLVIESKDIQEPSAPVAHSDSKTPIAPADDPESQPSPPKQPIHLPSRREPTPSSAPPLPKRKATRSPEDHARYGKCLEAIVTVNGVKLSDCPKSAIAIAGKAVNEIWGVMPSVTPEEILQRIQRARVKFSWMKGINERTIATKWAELAVDTKKQLTPENI